MEASLADSIRTKAGRWYAGRTVLLRVYSGLHRSQMFDGVDAESFDGSEDGLGADVFFQPSESWGCR